MGLWQALNQISNLTVCTWALRGSAKPYKTPNRIIGRLMGLVPGGGLGAPGSLGRLMLAARGLGFKALGSTAWNLRAWGGGLQDMKA